ncbi:MAG: tetratricopeptide repeat protein [Candidatus Omnitrophica bacterium]|nr:tetratricopeptide repeat protein [Candidatus Omnitrophota bacterium]
MAKKAAFIPAFLCCSLIAAKIVFAQAVPEQNDGYYKVNLSPRPYSNMKIPGFIQDIPQEFKDIVALHLPSEQNSAESQIEIIKNQVPNALEPLAVTPENDLTILKLAILNYERKDLSTAETLFENLYNRSTKRIVDENSFFYLGLIAAERQAYQECKYYFEEVLRINKKRTSAYINLGIALLYLKDYKNALVSFELALTIEPFNAIAYFFKGLSIYKNGEPEGALGYFYTANRLKSDDKVFEKWSDSLKERDMKLKFLSFKAFIFPWDPATHYRLGWIYLDYGYIDKAKACFDKALEADSGYTNGLIGLSEVALYKKDFKLAESQLLKIIEISPKESCYVYSLIGRVRIHAQDFEGAETVLNKAIKLDPQEKYSYPHALLGQVYLLENRLKEAQEELAICAATGERSGEVEELEMKVARYKRVYGN